MTVTDIVIPEQGAPAGEPVISTRAPRMLLIDDDAAIGATLVEAFGDEGFIVQAVEAREGLATVRNDHFDIILLDLGLPGIDGLEVLRLIKQDKVLQDLPVIVLTGWPGTEYEIRCLDAGASDYVRKPFDFPALRARVRAAVRTKRHSDELAVQNLELEAARTAAEDNTRSKSGFLAQMSHEIRTPMNGVIAMTSLLLRTELSPDQREYAETIRTSGESLLTIVNDILNIAKIEAGKLELENSPFDLWECLGSAIDLMAPKCVEKSLHLGFEMHPSTQTAVTGDATRLRQVVINLLSNAVKFTANGEVVLGVEPDVEANASESAGAQHLHVTVRDTGVGIAADRLHQLFHSFVQADSTIQRNYGGTGLGLAISKGIVELMNGRMWAESVPGQGSTFHFSVPLAAHEPSPALRREEALAEKRVLVVHENAAIGEIIKRTCEAWGMRAAAVRHAAQVPAKSWYDFMLTTAGSVSAPAALAGRVITLVPFGQQGTAPAGSVTMPIKPAALKAALLEPSRAPAPAQPARRTGAAAIDATMASRLPLRILVTDDNIINQKVACRLLQQFGYKADVAASGPDALAMVKRTAYDVVFMDVQMPGMDGCEATRRIRELERQSTRRVVTIIAMTASAMTGDREKCLAAGMDDYVSKPVHAETVQAMLEKHGGTRMSGPAPADSAQAPESPVPMVAAVQPAPTLAPPATGPNEALVDMDRLTEFSGASITSMVEITDLYLSQTQEQLERLTLALQRRDTATLISAAHSSAGASGVCGMVMMERLFRQLEGVARDAQLAEAGPLIESLHRNYALVKEFLINSRHAPPA